MTASIRFGSAVCSPAAAVRDPADLLHIDMQQRTGVGMLVSVRGPFRGTDHDTGDRVDIPQQRNTPAGQDPASDRFGHRRGQAGDIELGLVDTDEHAAHDRSAERPTGLVERLDDGGPRATAFDRESRQCGCLSVASSILYRTTKNSVPALSRVAPPS